MVWFEKGSVVFKNESVCLGTDAGWWEVQRLEGRRDGACVTWVGRCRRVSLASLRRHIGSIHRCLHRVEVRLLLELTDVLLVAYSLVAKPIGDLRGQRCVRYTLLLGCNITMVSLPAKKYLSFIRIVGRSRYYSFIRAKMNQYIKLC